MIRCCSCWEHHPTARVSQLLQMLDKLHIPRANLMGFSFAGTLAISFAAQHPTRVGRLALISSQIGGSGPGALKNIKKMHLARRATSGCASGCLRRNTIVWYLKKKMPPVMYERSEGQVEEGGDPDGLPVCKAMYRVKSHMHKLFEQLTDPTYFAGAENGCDELCHSVASAQIAVYARNYTEDRVEVNMEGFERVWEILRDGAPGISTYTIAPGKVRLSRCTRAQTLCHFSHQRLVFSLAPHVLHRHHSGGRC